MKKFRVWLFVAFLMAAAVAFRVLPVGDALMALLEWMRRLGPWGPVAAAILYVPAAVCMVPGSALTLCAGFLFGVPKGMVAMSLGSVAGACAAVLVGRVVARDWVRAKMAGHPRFHAVSQAVGREGFKMVFLLRLSPAFPFNLLNYAFSMTPISFGRYALASWLGMFSSCIMRSARVYQPSIKAVAASSKPRSMAL